MTYEDFITGKQNSVEFLKDEQAIKTLRNPLYRPIIKILREGYKTFKEIKKEYSKYANVPPDKTLYRHLKTLENEGLIFEIGKRVYTDQSMTEKLYARTAKFFHMTEESLESEEREKRTKRRAEIVTKIFELINKTPTISKECVEEIMKKSYAYEKKKIENLFRGFPDELVEIAGDLPADELQFVVTDFTKLSMLIDYPELIEELKKCLKIS